MYEETKDIILPPVLCGNNVMAMLDLCLDYDDIPQPSEVLTGGQQSVGWQFGCEVCHLARYLW